MGELQGVDILSAGQFTREQIELVLNTTAGIRRRRRDEQLKMYPGMILVTTFFEPSSRTRGSFQAAALRLGGGYIDMGSEKVSSLAKGEDFNDTIRTYDRLEPDVIVVRHPEIGSAQRAADLARSPVINAGDGTNEHPTQGLLDLYTIWSLRKKKLEGLTIALCGDLKNGRTVHSGVRFYSHFGCRLIFVSPDTLKMPTEITEGLRSEDVSVVETSNLIAAMKVADVLYMTRIQKERFDNESNYRKVSGSYILTPEMVERVNRPKMLILHPLPRIDEIARGVDDLPNAVYFEQVRCGLYLRMALLALVSGRLS